MSRCTLWAFGTIKPSGQNQFAFPKKNKTRVITAQMEHDMAVI